MTYYPPFLTEPMTEPGCVTGASCASCPYAAPLPISGMDTDEKDTTEPDTVTPSADAAPFSDNTENAYPVSPFYPYPQTSDTLSRDIRYMRQQYPKEARRLAVLTEETVDRYDRPCSFFYDAFPDRISLLHMLNEILDASGTEDEIQVRPLAEVLLLQEIFLRRRKRAAASYVKD